MIKMNLLDEKNDTNELLCKTKTDSENKLWSLEGGVGRQHVHTAVFKIDNQQGPGV